MRAWFEQFFSREWQRRSGWQILLQPFSWFFAVVTALRRALYKNGFLTTTNVAVPVIIVGNISVGGTGKTPLVVALANALETRGLKVGIITRGYMIGGAINSVIDGTTDGKTDVAPNQTQSDEATLMASRCAAPIVVMRQRVLAAQTLLAEHPSVNVVISDDGLQHYALQRDVEIAVIDGARGLGNGYLLPAGSLRESAARLNTVDCIVVNNTTVYTNANANTIAGKGFEAKMAETPLLATSLLNSLSETGKHVFEMRYHHERFSRLLGNEQLSAERFLTQLVNTEPKRDARIAAIAGIGNPDRFFSHLKGLGVPLHACRAFPDHHPFTAADFADIDAEIILMTEKDAVKCAAFAVADADLSSGKQQLWQMQIDAFLPEAFYDFVAQKISSKN